MGIVRNRLEKKKVTGGKTKIHRKRRTNEKGRLAANTKLGGKRVAPVRVRGGNYKMRGLRLDTGNFSWGSEAIAQQARILDVVYNATSNELVRTKTLMKNCIVSVDASPFKSWYAKNYGIDYGTKARKEDKKGKGAATAAGFDIEKASKTLQRKWAARADKHKIEKSIEDQLKLGRILCRLTSRPGQVGRADGAFLEGAELQFYMKKMDKSKK
jgi:small subunit ribosomal protein S8e